jgi:hypothetical protein
MTTNLKTYFETLSPETVTEDLELLECVEDAREFYTLLASNCQKYCSLLEFGTADIVNTIKSKYNFNIRRIDGHLLIKYRLKQSDRAIEVGFFDNDNTDQETMMTLQTSIDSHLKSYDVDCKVKRQHLALETEGENNASPPPNRVVGIGAGTNVEDFIPDVKPTPAQLASAGYRPVPEQLRQLQKELNKPSELLNDAPKCSNVKPHEHHPNQKQLALDPHEHRPIQKQPNDTVSKSLPPNLTKLKSLIMHLKITPQHLHPQIYADMSDLIHDLSKAELLSYFMLLL